MRRTPFAIALLLLLHGAGGCVNRVHAPERVEQPVTVYVADHGKHSSLLLPAGDILTEPGYVQYAFGDWKAFVENDNSMGSYVRAAFRSSRSAIGRETHATTNPAILARRVRAVVLEPVTVEAQRVRSLRLELEGYWAERADETVDNRQVRMRFVVYDGPNRRYSLWNQCNHTTARWLRRLDCRVWKPAMFSRFRVME